MNDLPRLHPRHQICRKATNELHEAIVEIWQRNGLTDAEAMSMVNEAAYYTLSSILASVVIRERKRKLG